MDEIKELNEQAVSSVMLGFTFDTTEVSRVNLQTAVKSDSSYRSEVMTGVQDPAVVVPKIKEELMKAGWQDVLDAAQKQVDEYMANQIKTGNGR